MTAVRTRFAPSPTGYLHVGGARTALYNYLFARANGGEFVLRIEDTDRERSEDSYTRTIRDSLTWLGIPWDDGPYYQSERRELYRAAAAQLLESGAAYWDEDPEKGRAVKMKMPDRIAKVPDLIHGTVEFDTSLADDFVIIKSDGYPSYNFACVVDDHEMGITHVIRGDEHLSNMPRQLLLYEALEIDQPKFAHIPMILGPDGAKLSKRHGATSVGEYIRRGLLPEALINFIALLGWSPGDDREIMSLEEMAAAFTIDRVRKVPSQLDNEKLQWMNGQYIMSLSDERLAEVMGDFFVMNGVDIAGRSGEWMKHVAVAYRQRMKTLDDGLAASRFIFVDTIPYEPKAVRKVLGKEGASERLADARKILAGEDDWTVENLESRFKEYCEREGVGFGKVAQPLRVAVTGGMVSPPIFETLYLVGRERSLERIDRVLEKGAEGLVGAEENGE